MTGVMGDQDRLGRALDRARVGEDRVLAARVRDEGAQVVSLLCGVLRMSHMHAPENEAFNKPMRDLTFVLDRLVELLGPVHLAVVEDQIYLNEIRLRTEDRAEGALELAEELRRHGVGGLTFRNAQPEAKLRALVGGFALKPAEAQPRAALQAALAARGLDDVELSGLYRFRTTGEDTTAARTPEQLAANAVSLADESFDNLGADRLPNPLPIRRAVAEMLAREDGLDAVPEVSGQSGIGAHALRVAQLALLLGEAAGLPDGVLQDLGMAAMFHDVGYAAREGTLPGQPGHPPPFSRHGSTGARLLLRQRGFHEAKVRRVRSVLAHHRDYAARPRPPLLARILRIADDYDTATQARGFGLAPDEALARLAAGAGSLYDPVLLQAFVNALGRWPPGTLLTLEDGRPVRVVSPARTRERFERPRVRVERGPQDQAAVSEILDLSRMSLGVRGSPSARAPEPAPTVPPDLDDFVLIEPPAAAEVRVIGPICGGAIAQVLSRIHLERLSGTLTLRQPGQESRLRLADGRASGAVAAAAGQSASDPLAVLSPFLTREVGDYALVTTPGPGANPESHAALGDAIVQAVRAITDPDVVRYELGDIDRVLVPADDPRLAVQRLRLDDAEVRVRSTMDGRLTARQVLEAVGLPAAQAHRALLALLRTGLVRMRA